MNGPKPSLLVKSYGWLCKFLWQRKHFISKEMLYLPIDMGGQGLIHIISRIRHFRIQFVYIDF